MHRRLFRSGFLAFCMLALPFAVGSCGINATTGPVTGPDVDVPPDGLDGNVSTTNDISLNCPVFPSTLQLGTTVTTSIEDVPFVETIAAPDATFTVTSVNVAGSFDQVQQIAVTVTTAQRFITVIVRAGSSTGGQIRVGDFFTDAFRRTEDDDTNVTLSSRPTVSVVDGFTRCNSSSGDLLQISVLETDPFATSGGLVRQFQATFRLGCIQGCISMLQ